MKVIFFGTGEFGLDAIKLIHSRVVSVVTSPPKPTNRGQKIIKNSIHEFADSVGIPVYHDFSNIDGADIGVVVSYGVILPKDVLDALPFGCINLHPSSLPRFRGAAPIERTIELGDCTIDVCVIQMTPRLDDGAILMRRTLDIDPHETAQEIIPKCSIIGAELILKTLDNYGKITPVPQTGQTSYAKKIQKDELLLDPDIIRNLLAVDVLNKIRAFNAHGCCYIMFYGRRLKVLYAKISLERDVFNIECKDGFIKPIRVIPEGKSVMDTDEFLRGIRDKNCSFSS